MTNPPGWIAHALRHPPCKTKAVLRVSPHPGHASSPRIPRTRQGGPSTPRMCARSGETSTTDATAITATQMVSIPKLRLPRRAEEREGPNPEGPNPEGLSPSGRGGGPVRPGSGIDGVAITSLCSPPDL